MQAIKICHFSSAHPSSDIRIFHKQCSSLSKEGFTVYLVVANEENKIVNGVNIINVESINKSRFTRFLKTSKNVYSKAISIDADIYHFHDPELLLYALKLKRKGKIVIYDVHEDVPKTILAKFWINKYLRNFVSILFKKFENYIAKRLDYIITATPHIRDRFLKVNPNTIDINNFPLLSELASPVNWSDKSNEVCYIGALTQIRGLETLIESVSKTINVRLNLAGQFDQNSFEENLKLKKDWDIVNNYGYINRKETIQIMSKSKVGMVTFFPVPNHIDSQPNKMFEYMSAGIPVIGSFFPLWKEILEVNECGICVNPEDSDDISKAIKYLIENEDTAEQMGKNGREAVLEKYNWGIEEKKLINIYKLLIKK